MRFLAAPAIALVAVAVSTGCGSPEVSGARAPAATGWSAVAEAPLSERHGAAVVWVDGRFLVVGGDDGPRCPPTADCVVPSGTLLRDGAAFDPVSGEWSPIAPSPVVVSSSNTAVVDDRLYVLTGGLADAPPSFLAYDSTTDTWTTLPLPSTGTGRLVAAGDVVLSIARSDEIQPAHDSWFDPATATWHRLPDDPLGPSFDRVLVAVAERMFLTARDLLEGPGAEGPPLIRMAELSPTMDSWTVLPETDIVGSDPVSTAGRLVFPDPGGADGGEVDNWGRTHPLGGILDPATGTWQALPDTPGYDSWPRLVVGDLVRVGDSLLDPVTLATTPIPDEPWGPDDSPSLVGSPGAVFAWGPLQSGTGGWLYTP